MIDYGCKVFVYIGILVYGKEFGDWIRLGIKFKLVLFVGDTKGE